MTIALLVAVDDADEYHQTLARLLGAGEAHAATALLLSQPDVELSYGDATPGQLTFSLTGALATLTALGWPAPSPDEGALLWNVASARPVDAGPQVLQRVVGRLLDELDCAVPELGDDALAAIAAQLRRRPPPWPDFEVRWLRGQRRFLGRGTLGFALDDQRDGTVQATLCTRQGRPLARLDELQAPLDLAVVALQARIARAAARRDDDHRA
jgi:hypothetical protein